MDTEFQNKMLKFMEQFDSRLTAIESSSTSSHSDTTTDRKRHNKGLNAKDWSLMPRKLTPVAKAMCSGRDKTAHDVIAHNIDWPHFYVTTTDNRPADYDYLTLDEFIYGYMCVHEHEPDPAVQSAMWQHLRELMLDLKQHTWAEVRSFHALILSKLEAGRASWLDLPGFDYIRTREGYLPPIPPEDTESGHEYDHDMTQP